MARQRPILPFQGTAGLFTAAALRGRLVRTLLERDYGTTRVRFFITPLTGAGYIDDGDFRRHACVRFAAAKVIAT
jgi:hypothetical protein